MEVTKEQLAALDMKQHEWDRANEAEREGLLLRLELDVDMGDGTADSTKTETVRTLTGDVDPDDQNLADPDLDPVAAAEKKAEKIKDEAAAAAADAEEAARKKELAKDPFAGTEATETSEAKAAREAAEAAAAAAAKEPVRGPNDHLLSFDREFVYAPDKVDTVPIQAKIDVITAERVALDKQIEDGDLTAAEALVAERKLAQRETAASIELDRAVAGNATETDVNSKRWTKAQDIFLDENKTMYGDDPVAMSALNMYVQQIGSKPENIAKGFMWVLVEADRQVRSYMEAKGGGKEPLVKEPTKDPVVKDPVKDPVQAKKPAPRIPDTSKVPPNVGLQPTADLHVDDDPYSKLDRLEGEAYERALNAMSPAARKAYRDSMGG